ncbi:outer membrane beta-barrel family protein [Aestuariibaculum lutulentum]|uniref:TonB-dependent receptor family protein n=1 Tax=Aestuariibaculum lutulentum TaxID=2920935 RepID=A0ABS9RLI9_9FLAO|nr:outer membrane beta-barrel family protein [Aestuariibaculum lutulentum]MCH4553821.1 TonB-dependent receptor family protein [Aestuariibaculum lutulentum]
MLKKLPLLFICFFPLFALTQNYTISGHVVDENKISVAFSNVILMDSDSEVKSGTTTDDTGDFKFENIQEGTYILKISYLGFEDYSLTFELYKNIAFNNIVLSEKAEALEGILVTAKRPTVKRLIDRVVFDVENSTLSNYNVLDVLKNTPGVMVADNKITVKNGEPIIYLNDKRVYLSSNEIQQLLEGTTAQNLKSIEVITNPPARYDAEGNAVINIVTSKNIVAGYNGSVYGNYKQGYKYPKYSLGTSHFFKADKLNGYLNYSGNPKKDYRHNNEIVNFKDELNETSAIWETDFKRTKETLNHNLNANIDYELNENNTLSFSSSILIAPEKNTNTDINSTTEMFSVNYVLDSLFDTTNRANLKTNNLAFNLDFVHDFKKEGEKLSVNFHHTNYDFTSLQNVNTKYYLPNENISFRENVFQTNANQKTQLYTGQLDYQLPLNHNIQIEAGIKVSDIDSESFINQFVFNNGQISEDIDEEDTFLYGEKNYAVYSSFAKDWDKWSFKTGLRVEHTSLIGELLLAASSNKIDYTKFFPSFYLSNQINDNNQIYFSYNKRISRPRYNDLNPFKYYLNDNTYIVGNPNLQPQIDDVFTLGYTLKSTYTFEVYYRNENNPSLQLFQQDNENNKVRYINTNIDRNISYGLDFMTYTNIVTNWNLYVLSSLFYYEGKYYGGLNENQLYTNDKWSVYGQIINYFSFLQDKSLTADISYNYISAIVDGPSVYSTRHGLDVSLRKSFWSNRASLSIGVTDAFNTQNFDMTNNYANQDLYMKSRMENRMFIFGFNYKFGNYKLSSNKKEIDLEERDRLENDNLNR